MSGCDGVGSGGFKQANIVASRAGAKRARAGMNPLSKTATNPKGEVAN